MSLILRSWGALLRKSGYIAKACASSIPISWYASAGALYEALTAKSPPGTSLRDILGHQHTPETGGTPLAMGLIGGFSGGNLGSFQRDILVADTGTWFKLDIDRDPHLFIEVSPGIDSTDTAKGGGSVALECVLIVEMTGAAASGRIRIHNLSTGTRSAELAFGSGVARILASDVPCRPGENEIYIEVRTLVAAGTIDVHEALFYEREQSSQPASSGANDFDYVRLNRP